MSLSKSELKAKKKLEDRMMEIKSDSSLERDSIWQGTMTITNYGDVFLVWEVSGQSKLAAVSKSFKKSSNHPMLGYEYMGEAIKITLEIDEDEAIDIAGLYSIAMLGSTLIDMISDNDKKMLKGLAHSSLCFMLSVLAKERKLPSKVKLDAQGTMVGKEGMEGLFNYYKSIGFEFSKPDKVEKHLSKGVAVPMKSKLKKVMDCCATQAKHKIENIASMITIVREE
jgi:hypothetical protein